LGVPFAENKKKGGRGGKDLARCAPVGAFRTKKRKDFFFLPPTAARVILHFLRAEARKKGGNWGENEKKA
jgi:hypothetical protein